MILLSVPCPFSLGNSLVIVGSSPANHTHLSIRFNVSLASWYVFCSFIVIRIAQLQPFISYMRYTSINSNYYSVWLLTIYNKNLAPENGMCI